MSAQSAAESLILEYVASPEFQQGLHHFMEVELVRADNMLGILRQFVNSPTCEDAHLRFWRTPSKPGPERQFDDIQE